VSKSRQLLDIIPVHFLPDGENPVKLKELRLQKQLSIRQLSKETGHSISYLQRQLRKFGIEKANNDLGVAPYGWNCKDRSLIKNAKEQQVICEILKLRGAGQGYKKIAKVLNDKGLRAKNGGHWWPAMVGRIIRHNQKEKRT
jgi:transcriptional regulator with XRE-family HTH domain